MAITNIFRPSLGNFPEFNMQGRELPVSLLMAVCPIALCSTLVLRDSKAALAISLINPTNKIPDFSPEPGAKGGQHQAAPFVLYTNAGHFIGLL